MGSADQQVKQDLEFNLFTDDRGQTLHIFCFFLDGEDFKQKLFKKIFNAIFLTCNFTIRFFWLMNL